MLNRIIDFSVNNKLLVGLFIIALIAYGSFEATRLPIDAVPDITDNQVQVITVTPSLGAPDVERLITFPIEQANSNIPGLKEIRSFSRFGLSLITIVFNDDVDVYWARQQVTERLKIAENEIPKGIGSPTLAPVTTGLGEIYQYVIRPKPGYELKYTPIELRTIQDWLVRRQLLGVKGVADVSSFGGRVKQFEIAVNPAVLKAHNVTVQDVFTALERNNENTGGAYIEKTSTVLYIRSEGLVNSLADIENIPIKALPTGVPLLIKDVAEVRIGQATRYGAITYNDKGEVAGAVVMMLKGENSSRVIADVKSRIEQIKKTLPEGVELEPFLDRTKMVNNAIQTVSKNLLEGALIVVFILVLFLGNLRAGLIVASVIPLSMLFAVILMNLFGVSGNLMSLGALDFGLIVDGAVIIVEAVMHKLTASNILRPGAVSRHEMDNMVKKSASQMMNSAVFGQVIILVVYLPIFTLEGIEGKMFKPMALTVAFALLGAFILSLTYVPMISALLLKRDGAHNKNFSDRMMDFFIAVQQKGLHIVLNMQKTVLAVTVLLLVGAIYTFTTLGGEFIPELPEGDFAVETRVLPGSNLSVSSESVVKSARVLLKRFPEVEKIVGKTGSGEIPTDPMPMEATDMMIILKDRSQWTSADSWEELAEKMGEALQEVPGVTFSFQYPVAMRFNELMTGAKQDVVCKIFGENLDTLSKYSKLIGGLAAKVQGAKDVYIEPIDGLPQLIIKYNRNAIAEYGMNIEEINRVVNMAFAGQVAGRVYEDEKRFDLVVRLAGMHRQNLQDVQNLLVPAPNGRQIPLHQVADVAIKESINQIQREDAKRRIMVGFNVGNRDVQSTVEDMQKLVAEKVKLPSGYYITYGGAFENLEAAKQRLLLAVPVSLILIFVLLYFAFGSLKQGLLIYSAIPLSAIGGTFFLALRGMPFSISAGVGFIALFGVAVLNGIVLIAEFNRIKKEGETDLKKTVLLGTKHRLRPVLMTAFVASLGFLPMAISHGAGAEVQRPLATVVIGGLLVATLLTLFILPILYIIFNKGFPMKKVSGVVALVLLFSASITVNAQQTIPLNAAIDTALKNNLTLRNEMLQVEYLKKIKQTAWDMPQTNVTADYGQINTIYNDTKFGVSQSIHFPLVYARQKAAFNEEWKSGSISFNLKQVELKKEVALTFYNIVNLQQKYALLIRLDSIYNTFVEVAKARFTNGETGVLEKATAETQRAQVQQQLLQLNQDSAIQQLRFQLLLNSTQSFKPDGRIIKLSAPLLADTGQAITHPYLKALEQQQQVSRAYLKLERSKLSPDLFVGYSNQSIIGPQSVNGTERNFTAANRFSSVQVGISLPILFNGQKARIEASKLNIQATEGKYEAAAKEYANRYAQLTQLVTGNMQIVNYYEQTALPGAEQILQSALQQLQLGEINYVEWVMLINQAAYVQSNYLDAVKNLNESIIELNAISNQ